MAEYTVGDVTIIDAPLVEEADKNSVRIIAAGEVGGDKTIDFNLGGCYTCAPTDTTELTVTGLGIGQRGAVHIYAGDVEPVVTFVGVDVWANDAEPTFTANKLTVVTLFNDGISVVGTVEGLEGPAGPQGEPGA